MNELKERAAYTLMTDVKPEPDPLGTMIAVDAVEILSTKLTGKSVAASMLVNIPYATCLQLRRDGMTERERRLVIQELDNLSCWLHRINGPYAKTGTEYLLQRYIGAKAKELVKEYTLKYRDTHGIPEPVYVGASRSTR